jgi:hypothetical protein
MNSLVATVLTSAFVTLAIEWLAKPRLEARKENILALHRGRRTFHTNLLTILSNSAKLATGAAHEIPRSTKEDLRRSIRAEADRAATRIDSATQDMSDNVTDYVSTYATERIRNLILRYVFTARAIAISTRTQVEKSDILKEITIPIHTWLFARWRLASRARAFTELPKVLDKYTGPNEVTTPARQVPARHEHPDQGAFGNVEPVVRQLAGNSGESPEST